MEQQKQWKKLNGQRIHTSIEDEVREVLLRERAAGYNMRVCIGTDRKVTEFATVIVFVRKGKGAFMYINNETTTHKLAIRQRMPEEVARSIDVAFTL